MKVLVTGATGFLGRHLITRLQRSGHEAHGISLGLGTKRGISHTCCDVLDRKAIAGVVGRVQPERIFHLAGFASARRAVERPGECWDLNVRGTIHVLEAARRHCPGATVVLVGSAMQYGIVGDVSRPIRESDTLQPREPYGASKAAAEVAGAQWAASYGLRVVLLRAFNITGPEQTAVFASADFARQIARIERGLQGAVVKTGNLSVARDLLDVRDAAVAFELAAAGCQPGRPYNVCSGEAVPIGRVLDLLRSMARVPFEIEVDRDKVRAVDIPVLRGDPTEFKKTTGWQPGISLQDSLRDLLDGWRRSIGQTVVKPS